MNTRPLLTLLALALISCAGAYGTETEEEDMNVKDYRSLFDNVPTPRSSGAKPVAVIPVEAKQGPWTGNQNLGSSRIWDPAAVGRQTIFKMPEWGMPQVWTVSLGIDTEQAQWTGTAAFDFTASVIFGVGGTTQQIELDWSNGSTLIVPANAIEVVARTYSDSGVAHAAPDNVRLSVQVARGSIGVPSATRTLRFTLAPGISDYYRIPNFARYVMILNGPSTILPAYDPQVLYWFQSGRPGFLVSEMAGNMLVNLGGVIPIPATARYMRVNNTSAASTVTPVLVFGLAY